MDNIQRAKWKSKDRKIGPTYREHTVVFINNTVIYFFVNVYNISNYCCT